MNTAAVPDQPIRHAPHALWLVAQHFLHILHGLFGAPEDVAADHTYVRKDYALLLSWLRCAEAMLRRLLLIEACAYAAADGAPASSRQATPRKPRQRRLVYFYPDKPEDWRVSFRCFAPEGRTFRQARRDADVGATPEGVTLSLSKGDARTRRKPKRFFDAWPVALRYEALVRVFTNPVPFAKRLARSLRAKPERVKDILRAPPQAEHRIDDFIEMGERAEKGAAIAFSNTS